MSENFTIYYDQSNLGFSAAGNVLESLSILKPSGADAFINKDQALPVSVTKSSQLDTHWYRIRNPLNKSFEHSPFKIPDSSVFPIKKESAQDANNFSRRPLNKFRPEQRC